MPPIACARRLLRARRKRPCRSRAAQQRDELAAVAVGTRVTSRPPQRQGGKLYPAVGQKGVAADENRVAVLAHEICKGGIDLPVGAGIVNLKNQKGAIRASRYRCGPE